jgi:ribosomal protein L2
MPIRKYNPTSPGLRGKTSLTFDEVTTSEPYRPLTENLHRSGGRNNQGHLTSWWHPLRWKETKSLDTNGGKRVMSGFVNCTKTVVRYEKLPSK